MKRLATILLIFTVINYSCQSKPPTDNTKLQKVTEKPDLDKLIGEWEIDNFSYDFISNKYDISENKVALVLNEDNSFKLMKMPFYDNFGVPKNTELVDIEGRWELKQSFDKKYWEMKLRFVLNKKKSSLNLMLFNRLNSGLILWYYVGDPDSGNRILFEKSK